MHFPTVHSSQEAAPGADPGLSVLPGLLQRWGTLPAPAWARSPGKLASPAAAAWLLVSPARGALCLPRWSCPGAHPDFPPSLCFCPVPVSSVPSILRLDFTPALALKPDPARSPVSIWEVAVACLPRSLLASPSDTASFVPGSRNILFQICPQILPERTPLLLRVRIFKTGSSRMPRWLVVIPNGHRRPEAAEPGAGRDGILAPRLFSGPLCPCCPYARKHPDPILMVGPRTVGQVVHCTTKGGCHFHCGP